MKVLKGGTLIDGTGPDRWQAPLSLFAISGSRRSRPGLAATGRAMSRSSTSPA